MSSTFHIVLVEPQIPPNTGNIGRLCVATGATLHLIHPLGFQTDEKAIRRSGMDYWKDLDVHEWKNLESFHASHPLAENHYFITTKAQQTYYKACFNPGDYYYFGREDAGLPESLLTLQPKNNLRIPMVKSARSINLATAVSVIVYEAIRQNFDDLSFSSLQ